MSISRPATIVPNLWFDTEAEPAAQFYCSVFPQSRVISKAHYTEAGPREAGLVMTVEFELSGQRFTAINGGPDFPFTEAVSFLVECDDQPEIDYYWEALLAGGGTEIQCGWLKDRYGLAWQVCPKGLEELFAGPDRDAATRAMQAMFGMKKLDLAALRDAAGSVPAG